MDQNPHGTAARPALPRFVLVALGVAGLAIAMQFARELKDILAPVFLGLNLVVVAYPLQRWLAGRTQRHLAATVALIVVLLVVTVFFLSTGWAVAELVRELPKYNSRFSELWTQTTALLEGWGVGREQLRQQFQGINAGNIIGLLTPVIANVSQVLALLATLVVAVFFLAMDSVSIEKRLAMVVDRRPAVTTALASFTHGVRRYWVVTTLFGLVVALLDVVVLAVIGVPLIWVWGVLAFLTNYIPNIGFFIGLVPPALLALLDGGPGAAIAVVAAYSIINFTVQAIIQPKIAGESVGVTPTISFVSLLFWYWVLGWMGALLALPATLLVKAFLVDADADVRWANALLAASPHHGDEAVHRSTAFGSGAGAGKDDDGGAGAQDAPDPASDPGEIGAPHQASDHQENPGHQKH